MDYISQQDDKDLTEDEESSDPTILAREILAEVNRSIPLPSLDACVALHRDALHLLPALSSECSLCLAVSLMLRFRHTSQLGDLDEAISLFAGLFPDDPLNIPPPGILASTSVAFLTKFVVTGSEIHRKTALAVHDLHQVCAVGSWVLYRLIKLLLGLDKAGD